MNSRSLRFRLITWYAGVLTVAFVLLGALTILLLRHYLEANLLDLQMKRARQIADTLLASGSRPGQARLEQEVEELYAPEMNGRFIRISVDGRVVYASREPRSGGFDPSAVALPSSERAGPFVRRQNLRSGALLIAALPYVGAGSTRYLVEVGASTASTDTTLSQMLLMLMIGLPVAVAICVSGGSILVRRALQPVDRIARKAEAITQHSLSERLPVMRTGDELERLSISLNHMISRLDDAVQAARRFVADASHELRTPLTVLRGTLEELAQDLQLKPPTRETLGSLLEEVDRLADIVEGLLALSRLDAGEGGMEWVSFDLADLALSTCDQMSLLAEDRSIQVVCQSTPGLMIKGDRARLKQVIVNLLDNAIKYTKPGGRVDLRVTRQDGDAVLDVIDNGIGIPRQALPLVFQRFYRADRSRSRAQGGAGLGLSIVASICALHGTQVEVRSEPGQGSTFRIRLPLASSHAVPAGRPVLVAQV